MSDVVIELPVRTGEESQLSGPIYPSSWSASPTSPSSGADGDAPYLMVCSNPLRDVEVKVLTFQQHSPPRISLPAGPGQEPARGEREGLSRPSPA